MERVLYGGMRLMNAKGAAAVLMDVETGEIVSLASLPDFDPNDRPLPQTQGDKADDPLFNRAVQGVYELGSTFKIITVAQAAWEMEISPKTAEAYLAAARRKTRSRSTAEAVAKAIFFQIV